MVGAMDGLRLVAGTIDSFDAELAGDLAGLAGLLEVDAIEEWPPNGGEHDAEAVAFFRRALASDPELAGWLVFYVCVGTSLVGSAGFMGRPTDGVAEIGYSICEGCRGRGFATGAVGALIGRARGAGARQLIARTKPTNAGSIVVLERNGFVRVAGEEDDLLLFARDLGQGRRRIG